ncbi:MAG: hypothetical protein HYX82_04230, partial [Chloroflexi bacterium]|nr:hypothetical protein [Chloroflexota bacterium]
MRNPLGQRGATLIELILSLSIAALIIPALASLVWAYIWFPPRQSDEIASFNDVEQAVYWVMRDTNAAESFTAGTLPEYGYFQWTDYTSGSAEVYKAIYYYQSGELLRDLKKNDVLQNTIAVAEYIASQSDASFVWSPTTYSVTVSVTSTVQGANSTQSTTYSDTFNAFLRTSSEGAVSPPGLTPIPTPPPGSVTYSVAADPVLIYGTWVSGNAASLQDGDSVYYTVSSASVGGAKEVTYTVYSQTITSPATINQIEVRWSGKSSRNSTGMQF